MNDINDMSFSVNNNISDLVCTINKNIYNFHKIVHKLQQNYKTNKLAIVTLSSEIKYLSDSITNINEKTEQNENMIDYVEIKIKDIKNDFQNDFKNEINCIKNDIENNIEKKYIENNKKFNEKFMYYIGVNILATSFICLVFNKIY
jgi:methyl-accepting chemotaxis protein